MENMSRLSNGQATTKRLKTNSEDYKACANDCITLHLFDPTKTQDSSWPPNGVSSSFKPDFTHQVFGDDEEIVGYKGLSVDFYFSQSDFQACIDIKFEDKLHGATDILSVLQEHFPGGVTADKQQYLAAIKISSHCDLSTALTLPEVRPGVIVKQATLASANQQLQVSCCHPDPAILQAFSMGKHAAACRLCIPACNPFCCFSLTEPVL